eukprot:TRINITY_DN5398_c0_g1_i2.p1 TRINITY_DN5398_c0_g1~~TRINITY_DN5398_c0_g1_i2.p1  ORF type:complete len:301 (-),score=57.95 TRINITY_DN5398_c0_g1_i2:19-921(-)
MESIKQILNNIKDKYECPYDDKDFFPKIALFHTSEPDHATYFSKYINCDVIDACYSNFKWQPLSKYPLIIMFGGNSFGGESKNDFGKEVVEFIENGGICIVSDWTMMKRGQYSPGGGFYDKRMLPFCLNNHTFGVDVKMTEKLKKVENEHFNFLENYPVGESLKIREQDITENEGAELILSVDGNRAIYRKKFKQGIVIGVNCYEPNPVFYHNIIKWLLLPEWSTSNHHYFKHNQVFCVGVKQLLLVCKRLSSKVIYKIPKPVLHMIFTYLSFVTRHSYSFSIEKKGFFQRLFDNIKSKN